MINPKQFTPEQDTARVIRAALVNLIHQIDIANPTDDQGHSLKMNAAYIHAMEVTLT